MNHLAALDTVTMILTRAGLMLRERHDVEGRGLAHDVEMLKYRVFRARAAPQSRKVVAKIADDAAALHERIVDYAERNRIRYLQIDSSPTVVMRHSEFPPEVRAAIGCPGDTLPPPAVTSTMLPPPPPVPLLDVLPPSCLDDDT